jgi:hypothetical protein
MWDWQALTSMAEGNDATLKERFPLQFLGSVFWDGVRRNRPLL